MKQRLSFSLSKGGGISLTALEVAFILVAAVLVIAGIVAAAFFIRKKYYKPRRLEGERNCDNGCMKIFIYRPRSDTTTSESNEYCKFSNWWLT